MCSDQQPGIQGCTEQCCGPPPKRSRKLGNIAVLAEQGQLCRRSMLRLEKLRLKGSGAEASD